MKFGVEEYLLFLMTHIFLQVINFGILAKYMHKDV